MAETIYYKILYAGGSFDFGFTDDQNEYVDIISEHSVLGDRVEQISQEEYEAMAENDQTRTKDFSAKVKYYMEEDQEGQDEFSDPKRVRLTILIHALSSGHPDVKTLEEYYNWITK